MERTHKILVTVPEPLNIVAKFKKEIAAKNADVLTYEDGEAIDHQIWLIGTIEEIETMIVKLTKCEHTITMTEADYELGIHEMDADDIIEFLKK
jgi:hypothetical protein